MKGRFEKKKKLKGAFYEKVIKGIIRTGPGLVAYAGGESYARPPLGLPLNHVKSRYRSSFVGGIRAPFYGNFCVRLCVCS